SVLFFFFSSRRRHTRFSRDWSSDVCSSDLRSSSGHAAIAFGFTWRRHRKYSAIRSAVTRRKSCTIQSPPCSRSRIQLPPRSTPKIGRASCRERVETWAYAETVETKRQEYIS